jgi:1,4-dihydroxy-2-naphthoyl-CoA synthase
VYSYASSDMKEGLDAVAGKRSPAFTEFQDYVD